MTARRTAITGAAGQLGSELVRAFAAAGDEVLALARPEFDISRPADLDQLTAWRPDVVVNSAAWTDVDGCARDPERAMRINGEAAGAVAAAGAAAGALSVQISTNEVFDGELGRPYAEDDEPSPINPYGASKLAGEGAVASGQSAAPHRPHRLAVRPWWHELRHQDPRRGRAGSARPASRSAWSTTSGATRPGRRGSRKRSCRLSPAPAAGRIAYGTSPGSRRSRGGDGPPTSSRTSNSPSCRSRWRSTHVPRNRPGAPSSTRIWPRRLASPWNGPASFPRHASYNPGPAGFR